MLMNVLPILLYSIMISSSIAMLSTLNPVNSVLYLMITFLAAAFFFISIGIDFLGFLIIIVYVGAIAILFLFIVMLISIKKAVKDPLIYFLIGIVIILSSTTQIFIFVLNSIFPYVSNFIDINNNTWFFLTTNRLDEANRYLIVFTLGIVLVYEYTIGLLIVAFLLLIATVGSIFLTNFKKGYSTRRQFNQLSRNNTIFNFHTY